MDMEKKLTLFVVFVTRVKYHPYQSKNYVPSTFIGAACLDT